jgi:hypothetical protein
MDTESWQKIRAIRRHRRERVILRRKSKVDMGRWHVKSLGYLAKNNTVYSCWMCGDPRKYFGQLTAQERKASQAWPVISDALSLDFTALAQFNNVYRVQTISTRLTHLRIDSSTHLHSYASTRFLSAFGHEH